MKTHSIQRYTSLKQGYKQNPAVVQKEHSTGLCENNNTGYNVAFSGSGASKKMSKAAAKVFSELDNLLPDMLKKVKTENIKKSQYGEYGNYPQYFESIKNTFWGRILGSKTIDKGSDFFDQKTSVGQAFMALFIAGGLRPATNIAMASKEDKVDSMYAASHAIASATIGYIVSATVLAPFDDAWRQITKDVKTHLKGLEGLLNISKMGARRVETAPRWGRISQLCKMSFDTFILGVPKAMLTIALIPPILKYVFGLEKKAKKAAEPADNNLYTPAFIDKPVFADFKGGC